MLLVAFTERVVCICAPIFIALYNEKPLCNVLPDINAFVGASRMGMPVAFGSSANVRDLFEMLKVI